MNADHEAMSALLRGHGPQVLQIGWLGWHVATLASASAGTSPAVWRDAPAPLSHHPRAKVGNFRIFTPAAARSSSSESDVPKFKIEAPDADADPGA